MNIFVPFNIELEYFLLEDLIVKFIVDQKAMMSIYWYEIIF
jgi:hypothetical protein